MSRSSSSRPASSCSSEPISLAAAWWSTHACGDGVVGHGRKQRVVGMLHDGGAAAGADRRHTVNAVVEHAGHQHPDGARPEGERHRPEQRVDRRPVSVLRRALGQHHSMVVHEEVPVGYGDTDRARPRGGAVFCATPQATVRGGRGSWPARSARLAAHAERPGSRTEGRPGGSRRGRSSASTPPADAPTATTPRSAPFGMTVGFVIFSWLPMPMAGQPFLRRIGPSRSAAGEVDATPCSGL